MGRFKLPLASRNLAPLTSDLLPLGDFACVLIAAFISTFFYTRWLMQPPLNFGSNFPSAALVVAVLAAFILYNQRFGVMASRSPKSLWIKAYVLRFTLFSGVVLTLGGISQAMERFPHAWLIMWFTATVLLTLFMRVVVAQYLRLLQSQGAFTEVVAVVGAGPVADRLMQSLSKSRPGTVELLGIFDDKIAAAAQSLIKPTGTVDQLIELSKLRKIDWILLTLPSTAEQRVLSIVQRLKTLSIPIGLCPQHVGLNVPYHIVNYVGDCVPVSVLADRPIKRWDAVIKGVEDYIIGGIIILLLLPLLALIAVAIKLDSPGPVIFKQRRHAFNNHEFDIYKFRSMRWDPTGTAQPLKQTSRDDDRFTRIGRFLRATSLDELPQLFNVLNGNMSLIGPRPHAVNMRTEDRLGHEITDIYAHRHRVKPGMTGWSQVNGARGATDTTAQLRRRVELDLHYIENWSLLLDLKILVLTCREVLKRTNAY